MCADTLVESQNAKKSIKSYFLGKNMFRFRFFLCKCMSALHMSFSDLGFASAIRTKAQF